MKYHFNSGTFFIIFESMNEIEKEFDKLIKKIPLKERHKKFIILTFGNAFYMHKKYKGLEVINTMEGNIDRITIISERDLKILSRQDIEEANEL